MATYERVIKNGKTTDRWRVRYRDGKATNPLTITCPDEKTARALSGKIEAWACMNPGVPYPREGAPRVVTAILDDVVVAWLRDLTRTKASGTVTLYARVVGAYAKYMGRRATIDMMNATTIAAWDATRTGTVGENTRNAEIGNVSSCWQWAWAHRADVAVGAVEPVKVERPALTLARTVAPTWAESAACIERIATDSLGYRRAVSAYYTGLRTFQITGAYFSDRLADVNPADVTTIYNLETGTMTVIKGKTKAETSLRRCVPLAPAYLEALRTWHAMDPSARVAPGNEANSVKAMTTAWRLAHAAGKARMEVFGPSVETGKCNYDAGHAMRRGLTTGAKRAGVDNEAVEYYVGHAMPGQRGSYLDASALDLVSVVAAIPPLPSRTNMPDNVIAFLAAAK